MLERAYAVDRVRATRSGSNHIMPLLRVPRFGWSPAPHTEARGDRRTVAIHHAEMGREPSAICPGAAALRRNRGARTGGRVACGPPEPRPDQLQVVLQQVPHPLLGIILAGKHVDQDLDCVASASQAKRSAKP
jgi:hypothetical protein